MFMCMYIYMRVRLSKNSVSASKLAGWLKLFLARHLAHLVLVKGWLAIQTAFARDLV